MCKHYGHLPGRLVMLVIPQGKSAYVRARVRVFLAAVPHNSRRRPSPPHAQSAVRDAMLNFIRMNIRASGRSLR